MDQGPVHIWDPSAGDNPEAADIDIVPFNSFYPKNPVVTTDVKVNEGDFVIADMQGIITIFNP